MPESLIFTWERTSGLRSMVRTKQRKNERGKFMELWLKPELEAKGDIER